MLFGGGGWGALFWEMLTLER